MGILSFLPVPNEVQGETGCFRIWTDMGTGIQRDIRPHCS